MMWRRIFERKPAPADTLYGWVVAQARGERFYAQWGVPDTVDGRFDMIVLHLFLAQNRLQAEGEATRDLQQDLTDTFFKDMDRSLREMGVGDLSVGKKVRKMAEACYGRLNAYGKSVADGQPTLQQALARNIFAEGGGQVEALADWVMKARTALAEQPVELLIAGKAHLP